MAERVHFLKIIINYLYFVHNKSKTFLHATLHTIQRKRKVLLKNIKKIERSKLHTIYGRICADK